MPSLSKLNMLGLQTKEEENDGEEEEEEDEVQAMMNLFAEEEWLLAMVSKEKIALGKQAKKKEKTEIRERITRERHVKRKLAA